MGKRTIRDFKVEGDLWSIVDNWAKETGYKLRESSDAKRLYQKGQGVLVAPMMLEVRQAGTDIHLEAWVRVGLFVRLSSLFLFPSEMGIESGGFRGVAPRKIARTATNKLLEMISQPPIP